MGPTQPPIQRLLCIPGVKRPGRDINHTHPSSAEVKDRVELYIHSLSGLSWPVLGRTLPLPWIIIHKEHELSLPLRYFIMRQSDEIHQVNCIIRNSCSVSFMSEYLDILPDCFTIQYGNVEDQLCSFYFLECRNNITRENCECI
jgi:hypothetical protein